MQVLIRNINNPLFVVEFEHGPDYEVKYPLDGAISLLFPKAEVSLDKNSDTLTVEWEGDLIDFHYAAEEGVITFDLPANEPSVALGFFEEEEEVRINHFNAPLPTEQEEEGEKK